MAQLVDQYGNPLKRQEITRPYAGPTTGGVRPVISGHPAEGLNPRRLSAIHRAAAEGDPLSYLELAEDIEERDLHYFGVMSTRKRSVAQLPITVKPASDAADHKKHAEFVQSWINDDVLRACLFDMLDAIGKGFSVMEIDWQTRLSRWEPREITYRPQRWFTFARADGETVVLRDDPAEEPLPAHKFIIHRHPSKSGLTIRSGIARVASWAWMYKSFTLKDWAIFVQNFGMPIRIGRYEGDAKEEDKDVLWRAVTQIAGDMAAIMPDSMKIEFQEVAAKGTSIDLYERRADWMDRQVSKAVLGQTTTTDAVGGGHAVAREHRLVQEDIERADAMMITATIIRQLIPNLIAMNFGPQDHYPIVRIGRPDEVMLKEFAEAFDKFAKHGLTVGASYIRERLGAPAPVEGEEVIGGRQPSIMDRLFESEGRAPELNSVRKMLHAREKQSPTEDIVGKLTDRLQDDAAGALAGLTEEIRTVLMSAETIADAADQLARMKLSPDELSQAMARGMALAHLAGQAALIDDIAGRK